MGLLPQGWHRLSHIISTTRNVVVSQCLGRIAEVNSNTVTQACMEKGTTPHMDPRCQVVNTYIKLINCHVFVANNVKILCLGRGSVSISLGDRPLLLRNLLHVLHLDIPLLLYRVHRGRGQGCRFLPDTDGCFLTFSTFFLKLDDRHECALLCGMGPPDGPCNHKDAPNTLRRRDAFNLPYLVTKRAIGALLRLQTRKCCGLSPTSTSATCSTLLLTIPAVSP
jgi:hypothetical protein